MDEKKCCDIYRYGTKVLFVLSWPIVANSVHLIDSCVGTVSYYQGYDLPSHQFIEVTVGIVVIVNLTLINYFQLKIAGIAAI